MKVEEFILKYKVDDVRSPMLDITDDTISVIQQENISIINTSLYYRFRHGHFLFFEDGQIFVWGILSSHNVLTSNWRYYYEVVSSEEVEGLLLQSLVNETKDLLSKIQEMRDKVAENRNNIEFLNHRKMENDD